MNMNWQKIKSAIPHAPDWKTDWTSIRETSLQPCLSRMRQTNQNPLWHGEGDVWTHTEMVCEELAADREFRELPEEKRQPLFLAVILHDIGKISCTRFEDGAWVSPGHTVAGAKMARELLWREFGLCGERGLQNVRECACTLIRNHSVPLHILEQENPERRLIRIAAQGELAPGFTLSLLRLLVRADIKGRISRDRESSLEMAELCFSLAEELEILDAPLKFQSPAAEHAYLSGKKIWPGQDLYDDTWGEVILMSGLPGTGKDTWIRNNCPGLPMVSLDEIRERLGISPREAQGEVIREARRQAKELLRQHSPFVWNATDITSQTRKKQVDLFEQYQARVRIVFLETGWETGLERNSARDREVPRPVIEKMLGNLEPPERFEAQEVDWICV